MLEWRDRNNQPERLTPSLVRFQLPLKSRHFFLSIVQPANFPATVIRCSEWRKRLLDKPHIGIINLHEEMTKGYDSPWTTWIYLNHLRTGYTCNKAQRKKWKFYTGDTTCSSGRTEETTAHMLQCFQLAHPCSLDDLIMLNDVRKQCAELWKNMV